MTDEADEADEDFDFYGRPTRPAPEEVAPPLLPVARDPTLLEVAAEARRLSSAFAVGARYGRGLAPSSNLLPENVGFAMSNVVRSVTGGGPRGLPIEVLQQAMRLGDGSGAWRMEGRLPPPGTSAIANAETVMERRMERPGLYLYVGITEAPALRWHEHCSRLVRPVGMTVVQQAPSSRHTADTEQALIAFATRRWGRRCLNVAAGGQRASVGSPHYAYIVWSEGPIR